VFVDRVAPSAWPDDPPLGHFAMSSAEVAGDATDLVLTWAHPEGVANIRLKGNLARALLPDPLPAAARWTATPAAAAAAERWVGSAVTVMSPAERLLLADRSLWNLRQFDLARSTRGSRALQDSLRRFMSAEWRTVRYGLAALVVTQVLGLNLWAWHQRDAVEAKRRSLDTVLRETYPQVRAILDAPVQMRRETDTLRAAAGKPADNDLEPLLQAASLAWPPDRPPVESLRFEPGRLTLAASGWTDQQVEAFRIRVQPAGWRVESTDGRLTLSRAPLASAAGSNGVTP
jgi:general secretion pathway protein L